MNQAETKLFDTSKDQRFTLLNDGLGMAVLSKDLKRSAGNAAIITHPFYPEVELLDESAGVKVEKYNLYRARLFKATEKYKQLGMPIILFEEESEFEISGRSVTRLGISGNGFYVVLTEDDDPDPIDSSIDAFADKLAESGLKKAVVSGSNLWLEEPTYDIGATTKVPKITQKFNLDGCVGEVIESLLRSGVYATPGFATYPRDAFVEPEVTFLK